MSNMWYYSKGGTEKQGPVSEDEIRKLLSSGQLQPSDLVWTDGMTAWATVSSQDAFRSTPAASPAASPAVSTFPRPMQAVGGADLPDGLLTWMGFVGVMSIIMGALNCLSCFGIIMGIPMIIAGVALMGAKTALQEVEEVGAQLSTFFEKLKTAMLSMGIFYIITVISTVIVIIMYFGIFAAAIAAAGSGAPM